MLELLLVKIVVLKKKGIWKEGGKEQVFKSFLLDFPLYKNTNSFFFLAP
jgi:hypothetical protein